MFSTAKRENHLAKLQEELARLKELDGSSEMEDMHLIEYESDDGKVYQRTELTERQTSILFSLEIPEPAKILDISLQRGLKT